MQDSKTFKNGLKFSSPLEKNLDLQVHRVQTIGKASLIIIDGGLGEGKTTIGVHCAEYIMKEWFKDDRRTFDLKTQYAMGGQEFQEKLKMCYDSGLPVILYDEAGDFNTKGALSRFNKQLNRIFETFRAFRIIVILILPSFDDVDKSLYKKKIARMLINCFARTPKSGSFRVYSLKKMYYLKYKLRFATVSAGVYSYETPNFYGKFYDLNPKQSKELEDISMKGKLNIVSENIIKNKGLVSYKDMAQKLERSVPWVKQKILQLKVKEKQIYKKRKYFDGSIIERLEKLRG